MAVVYFTNNASTGAGSLAAAILSATAGDVIQPDATVFERGLIIEIALSSTLTIGKALTFNGGPYRVRLNGGGAIRCANITDGATVEFVGFDFVGSSGAAVTTTGDVTFDRCRIAGANGDGVVADGKTVTLKNSVVCGNNGRPVSTATALVNGSTIIGNVESLNAGSFVARNSIFPTSPNVAPSLIGFVAAPPDNFIGGNWTANAWQNWDLRLLDDASPTPSSYRDSGDVDTMTQYDFQGNFRGRETNGVATCSPGAYETLQADLFWVGRDATGAEVVSSSWVNSDGWATSRFATASGDAAPQKDDVVFVDGDVSFDGCGLALTRFIVGGGAKIGFAASGTQTLNATYFDVGVGASLESTAGTQKLAVRNVSTTSRFGDYAYIETAFSSSASVSFQIASTARFNDFANSQTIYRQGFFKLYRFNTRSTALVDGDVETVDTLQINNASGGTFAARNDPRIVCRSISWYRQPAENGATSALTEGSTPLIIEASEVVRITGDVLSSDCRVDASRATPDGTLSLTLTGQTVYGDAPSSAVSLTGSATIDERRLLTQSLTMGSGASIAFESDAQLVAVSSATFATVNFAGDGTVFAPIPVPAGATLSGGAAWANTAAGVMNAVLSPENATTVGLVVEKTTAGENIVAQYSTDGTTWQQLATSASVNAYEIAVPRGSNVSVRVAGPNGWIVRSLSLSAFLPVWTVTFPSESVTGIVNAYEIAPGGSNTGNNSYIFSGWGDL